MEHFRTHIGNLPTFPKPPLETILLLVNLPEQILNGYLQGLSQPLKFPQTLKISVHDLPHMLTNILNQSFPLFPFLPLPLSLPLSLSLRRGYLT